MLVLLDREDSDRCAGELASEVEAHIRAYADCEVRVVLKDRMFENWLVADIACLRSQAARFSLSGADEHRISPNRADSCDALAIIKRSIVSGRYDKVQDAKRILNLADPLAIGRNSRSFRRFLRLSEHPTYGAQSRLPT